MKTLADLESRALELIQRTSTRLPDDVISALKQGRDAEASGSAARAALDSVLENIVMAGEMTTPICQDTGTPIFYIKHPWDYPTRPMKEAFTSAVRAATAKSLLRPNSVDSLSGANSGDNTGDHFPVFHFEQWERPDEVRVDLMLKGGGCENMGIQYSLPHAELKAGRDLDGVRKVILDGLVRAQGQGCGPAVIGVCIGADRTSSASIAKEQILRPLADRNPDKVLAQLEDEILAASRKLQIGPMGFGGATTLLGVKIAKAHRLPASYFVSIAYMCWASRHRGMTIKNGEVRYD